MPLQNRVDPFGSINADHSRGLFTGNRGILHDPDRKVLLTRRWTTKAWIICALHFRNRRREVMGHTARSGRAGWTELFFLDEVTAMAAGHRPCFHCRNYAARRFAACFPEPDARAQEMDRLLHTQRRATGVAPARLDADALGGLPDGAMVACGDGPFALMSGRLLRWRPYGYAISEPPEPGAMFELLTPPATVEVLRNGFRPVWHPSAEKPLSDGPR